MMMGKNDSGSALVEFALALPVLLSLLMVSVDFSQLMLMTQKVQRLAGTMGDLVAQADTLSAAQLDSLFAACAHIAEPFDHAHSGRVIISAVVLGAGNIPVVAWQRADQGGLVAISSVGHVGGTAILPPGLVLSAGQTLIVAEAYQAFTPTLAAAVLPARTVYDQAYDMPRLGSLAVLN
jgi:Flp pilus assembly protein TadG